MAKTNKKFKAVEKEAVIKSKHHAKTELGDVEWQGEELSTESKTKLEDDKGEGQPIVLRFVSFGADPQKFKDHQPSGQELFNTHIKGMESLLWGDGLRPFYEVQPQILFSVDGINFEGFSPRGKQYKFYRFTLACLPMQTLLDNPMTLSQLIAKPTK